MSAWYLNHECQLVRSLLPLFIHLLTSLRDAALQTWQMARKRASWFIKPMIYRGGTMMIYGSFAYGYMAIVHDESSGVPYGFG